MIDATYRVLTAALVVATGIVLLRPEAPSLLGGRPVVSPDDGGSKDPWGTEWESIVPVRLALIGAYHGLPRALDVRSVRSGETLTMMLEWSDPTEDRSFEGAYYPSAVFGSEPVVQESKLLRDGLFVRFSDGVRGLGTLVWRSQWQSEFNTSALATAKKEFGVPVVDYYPIKGEGVAAARFRANTNAIDDPLSPCQWISRKTSTVYLPSVADPIEGVGRWRSERWRVVFHLPIQLIGAATEVTARISVVDGGATETDDHPSRALPVVIATAAKGGKP